MPSYPIDGEDKVSAPRRSRWCFRCFRWMHPWTMPPLEGMQLDADFTYIRLLLIILLERRGIGLVQIPRQQRMDARLHALFASAMLATMPLGLKPLPRRLVGRSGKVAARMAGGVQLGDVRASSTPTSSHPELILMCVLPLPTCLGPASS